MLGPGCGHTHTAEKCRGQEIFKLHGMQMLADPRPRLRHPLTRTHNNPDWGASCPGPPWLTLHTMGYHTCLTWRLKTRGWEWHVSCPQCHTGGVQESQESLDRSHTGRADRRLPTGDVRDEVLRIAARRTVSSLVRLSSPAAVPGFPPDICTHTGAGHGVQHCVSVLVTCSLYSQSYGGYLKISICVQFKNIVALSSWTH